MPVPTNAEITSLALIWHKAMLAFEVDNYQSRALEVVQQNAEADLLEALDLRLAAKNPSDQWALAADPDLQTALDEAQRGELTPYTRSSAPTTKISRPEEPLASSEFLLRPLDEAELENEYIWETLSMNNGSRSEWAAPWIERIRANIRADRAKISQLETENLRLSGTIPVPSAPTENTPEEKSLWDGQVGPFYDPIGVQNLLAITETDLEQQVAAMTVLGLKTSDGHMVYPVWQFQDGKTLPGLTQVLGAFQGFNSNPWYIASWLQAPQAALGMPISEWLSQAGDPELAYSLARLTARRLTLKGLTPAATKADGEAILAANPEVRDDLARVHADVLAGRKVETWWGRG